MGGASDLPGLDDAGQRLVRRFGDDVQPWLKQLPGRLRDLKERWRIELDGIIPRGSMSVVIRCRTAQPRRAVLKISPDLERIQREMAVLAGSSSTHVPTVYQMDLSLGALLMEQIEPGVQLLESGMYPSLSDVAELLTDIHTQRVPDMAWPSVADRVTYLFAAWKRERQRDPRELELVPDPLFERGRRLALRLAEEQPPRPVLLHGDFTPVNILQAGDTRGLVAIDPCPTFGDRSFDAVDMILWQAADVETIYGRAEFLAPRIGVETTRLVDWCIAFAGMTAADLAGTGQRAEPLSDARRNRIRAALTLAKAARAG